MDKNKIVVITDFDDTGSGYRNLCTPLLIGLAQKGYDIKVVGLSYRGLEHNYPFSVCLLYTSPSPRDA